MKNRLLTLATAIILSITTTYAVQYDPNNPRIASVEDNAVFAILAANKDILMLPYAADNSKITRVIPESHLKLISKNDYALFHNLKDYYQGLNTAQYTKTIQNDFHLYRARFIEELKKVIVERTKHWHRRFKNAMKDVVAEQDRQIRKKKDSMKQQINDLKSKLRNDETHTKNWYRPRIKDGSKTKAHLKGRLIEIKNKFNAQVRALEVGYDNFRRSLLANRHARYSKATEILRNDTNKSNLDRLKISFTPFLPIKEYDYDAYIRNGGEN